MFQPYNKRIPTKNDITALPFDELGELCNADPNSYQIYVDEFAQTHGIKSKSWVYPQILAFVSKWEVSRNSSNLFSPIQMLKAALRGNLFNQGIYYFCMSGIRFLDKQYTSTGAPYCALVPLLLAAHKKMNGVTYQGWDPLEIHHVVDPTLLAAMQCQPPLYSREDLIEFRNLGSTVKTGKSAGTLKNPVSNAFLTGLPKEWNGGVGPGELPRLAVVMLCQTWCAHPLNRNSYMVLDPYNWDLVPEPLVLDEPIQKSTLPAKVW